MLTVIAKITAKSGKVAELKKVLISVRVPTLEEAGCKNYDLYQSHEDPNIFFFYENWESKEALDKHLKSPHLSAFKTQTDPLLVKPIEMHLLHEVTE
ncbi:MULTISPECIES: putative quinol monooxygenase [Parachlamydia]|jgi:quinol monooxygenase YgiN|uniref:Uncharacterized protein sLL1783 n=2 Tax=Parachlamydia acanthamoebae TaxID=83552 RepID=F8KZ66_PARAV|nr:putative quinol monooxygenase [Parachlamydia acanthamoebae]EFB41931.1 hypothetical protein pah_c022o254 [Parachlamydia acanthamoebae str. Hall's coccus]CCB86189.1 uncharacterized protein sLL1783 [Parachlamydia acanthamoebae UV-7]